MIRHGCRWFTAFGVFGLGLALLWSQLAFAQSQLSPEQQRKLFAECNGLWQDAMRLKDEGKIDEAIATGHKAHAVGAELWSKSSRDYATSLNFLGLLYRIKGDDAKAEPLWREALEIRKQVLGEKHADYGQSLNNLGALYHAIGDHARAEPLLRRGMEVRKEALGAEHSGYAQSLHNLAALYWDMADKAQAEPLHREALAVRRKALGDAHPDVAQSAYCLGVLYSSRGEHERAASLLAEAVDIRRKVYGIAHPDYGVAVRSLAELKAAQRDFTRAESLFCEALAIMKKATGGRDRDFGATQMNLAMVYQNLGDYARAEPLFREGLQVVKSALGENHLDFGNSLHNLANLYVKMEDFARAEPLLQKSLAIKKQALDEASPDYAETLNSLGNLYLGMADFARAEPLIRQALEIKQKALGPKHRSCANSLSYLGRLYEATGDYERAEPLYRQAMEIWRETEGKTHPEYGATLHLLSSLYRAQGNLSRARSLAREAVEVYRQALGDTHPDYADVATNLAWIYELEGHYDLAEALAQKVVAIRRNVHGEEHPSFAAAVNNLAHLYVSKQEFTKAEPLYRQAIDIWKEHLDESHPTLATGLNNLARVCRSQGNYAQAEPACREALAICRTNLDRAALAQSERQQIAMLASLQYYLDNYLSLALEAGQFEQACYEQVLNWKGMVAARQRWSRATLDNPQLRSRLEELSSIARELSRLALALPANTQRGDWQRRVSELSDRKERLEAELSRDSAAFRAAARPANVADLQQALADHALIDLVEFDHWRLDKSANGGRVADKQLVAFVIRREGAVQMIDLGPVAPVRVAAKSWGVGYGSTSTAVDAGHQLRTLVWDKIEPHLARTGQVLVSPAGPLNRVPLGALPGKKPGTYLIEEWPLSVIAAPQGIHELLQEASDREATQTLLVVGDIDYDADAAGETNSAQPAPKSDSRAAPLAGAKEELAAIAKLHRQRFGDSGLTTLDQARATESAFCREAPRHAYLHLATHGFFAPPSVRSILSRSAHEAPSEGSWFVATRSLAGYHPNLLSGLILAGANQHQATGDDGILTAEEVQSLDLRGVDLVVLSACDTGLGEEAGGEGLLGLQRAFQVAGAKTVVASAWKLHDTATRDLMERFYNNLLVKKMGKVKALREAQLWMLRERGVQGLVAEDSDASKSKGLENVRLPPLFWGALVLSGDWR